MLVLAFSGKLSFPQQFIWGGKKKTLKKNHTLSKNKKIENYFCIHRLSKKIFHQCGICKTEMVSLSLEDFRWVHESVIQIFQPTKKYKIWKIQILKKLSYFRLQTCKNCYFLKRTMLLKYWKKANVFSSFFKTSLE